MNQRNKDIPTTSTMTGQNTGQASNPLSPIADSEPAVSGPVDDTIDAYVTALSLINDHPDSLRAELVSGVREHIAQLKSVNTEKILTTLAGQALLTEVLALEFAGRVGRCPNSKPEAAVALLKASLSAMNSYGRCVAAIDAIRSKALTPLDHDDEGDPDSDSEPGRPGRQRRGEG
jgi:hypothetical protein